MRYCQWPSDGPSQVEPGLDLFGKRINDGKFQRSKGFDCCVQVAHLWWEAGARVDSVLFTFDFQQIENRELLSLHFREVPRPTHGYRIWELMLSIILDVYRTPFYVCGKALTC